MNTSQFFWKFPNHVASKISWLYYEKISFSCTGKLPQGTMMGSWLCHNDPVPFTDKFWLVSSWMWAMVLIFWTRRPCYLTSISWYSYFVALLISICLVKIIKSFDPTDFRRQYLNKRCSVLAVILFQWPVSVGTCVCICLLNI